MAGLTDMKVIIMAGGRGTRISSVFHELPKPMIRIGDKPILEHQIDKLREQGLTDIIITVSYLSNIIIEYFGDGQKKSPVTRKSFGVRIEYFEEEKPLGNAGALPYLKDKIRGDFILLNGDIFFDINFEKYILFHKKKGSKVTLFAHPNNHPYDSGLLLVNENDEIVEWIAKEDEHPRYYNNLVNAGIHIISEDILKTLIPTEKLDLDREVLKPLSGKGKMYAYKSPEYVKDMGTFERYKEVCDDYLNNRISSRSLCHKQKAIFLDRDGVINKYVGFLRNTEEFELDYKVGEAIKLINESGYLAIVITNQPVVARGELTMKKLYEIHKKMETLLGHRGAYLDDIYICPHHPNRGYKGEIISLKIECQCRKPKPGLILKAAEDYNIDLMNSWMIGDSLVDVEAGRAAGCRTGAIRNGKNIQADLIANNLFEMISNILDWKE